MNLASEYRQQRAWRDWATAIDALPPLRGKTVLDLGCGVGDQAAELVARGARVIGVDGNEELLQEARARQLADVEFHRCDLRTPPELGITADGLWCSFAAAYFPDLSALLAPWSRFLRPGGWVALTEIDDLFGHEPLGARSRTLLEAYARDSLEGRRYDFHMGSRLRSELERCGFTPSRELVLSDQEFSFAGAARPEVLAAWRRRFERMQLLRDSCGADFEPLRREFLECLGRPDHRSRSKVHFCLATR